MLRLEIISKGPKSPPAIVSYWSPIIPSVSLAREATDSWTTPSVVGLETRSTLATLGTTIRDNPVFRREIISRRLPACRRRTRLVFVVLLAAFLTVVVLLPAFLTVVLFDNILTMLRVVSLTRRFPLLSADASESVQFGGGSRWKYVIGQCLPWSYPGPLPPGWSWRSLPIGGRIGRGLGR